MKKMLFSVLIPCYNAEKYIKECLDSVINQNFNDYEIICVNDGSTDNTYKILKDIKKEHKNLKIFNIKHKGVAFVRNVLLKKAKGEYIVFLDSDDLMCENLLYELSKHKNDNIDCFVGKFKSFSDSGKGKLIFGEEIKEESINNKSQENVFIHFKNVKIVNAICRFIVKTKIIKEYKIFFHNGIIHEDEEWVTKLLVRCKKFYTIPQLHFLYRRHKDSITANISEYNYGCKLLVAYELLNFSQGFNSYQRDFILRKIYKINKEIYYSLKEEVGDIDG